MIVHAVYQVLSEARPVIDAVGARVYVGDRPPGSPLPAVLVERGSNDTTGHHLKGPSTHARGSVRVVVIAQKFHDAGRIARIARDELNGYRGTHVIDGRPIRVAYVKQEGGPRPLPSDHRDGQGLPLSYATVTDFRFQIHKEAA